MFYSLSGQSPSVWQGFSFIWGYLMTGIFDMLKLKMKHRDLYGYSAFVSSEMSSASLSFLSTYT